MKTFVSAAVAALVLGADAALNLSKRESESVIGLDLQKEERSFSARRVRERQIDVTLDNERYLYYANISVGTPPQPLRVHIDTGSSDLWVQVPSSQICQSGACSVTGTFDRTKSSTYKKVNSQFKISYLDGSSASGDYGSDVIALGGQQVPGLQFGIGLQSTSEQAVFGIGYREGEAGTTRYNLPTYDNIAFRMVADGLIKSPAYSLWLNDYDASTGRILFGGVDTEKYVGNLATISVLKVQGESSPSAFIVTLTSITVDNGSQQQTVTTSPIPVVLDSGSTFCLLPSSVANQLYSIAGAQIDPDTGTAIVSCALASGTAVFRFDFSGAKIDVPLNEMVVPLYYTDGTQATDNSGNALCRLGVTTGDSGIYVLGDTFLRSAYVVYDMGNNEISLAQTNFNATKSNILAIGTGADAVPNAAGVSSQVMATVTQSFTGVNGGSLPTKTPSASAASTTTHNAAPALSQPVQRVVYGVSLASFFSYIFF